jgi:hypothetical protein
VKLGTEREANLVCSLSQPKSDISDFGQFEVPNSGKPEFGRERGGVRGYSLSIGFEPPHPHPLPNGERERAECATPPSAYSPNTQIIVACECGRISGERVSLPLALRQRPEAMAMYCLPSTA